MVAAQFRQGPKHQVPLKPAGLEDLLQRRTPFVQQSEQQVFRADVIILELARLRLCRVQGLLQLLADEQVRRRNPLDFVPALELPLQVRTQLSQGHPDLLQQIGDQAFRLADHGQQQMLSINLLMRIILRDALRLLQRFLRFNGQAVQLHTLFINPLSIPSRPLTGARSGRREEVPYVDGHGAEE